MAWRFRNTRIFSKSAAWMRGQCPGELTYRVGALLSLCVHIERVYDLPYNDPDSAYPLTYGDVFLANEQQQSRFSFELSDPDMLMRWFADAETQAKRLPRSEMHAAGL